MSSEKRSLVIISLSVIVILVVLVNPLPYSSNQDVQNTTESIQNAAAATPTPVSIESPEAEGKTHFPALIVSAVDAERGFQLTFDEEQHPNFYATVSTPSFIVHAVSRYDYDEKASRDSVTMGYDAVVVNPKTREIKVYPMYEASSDSYLNYPGTFTLIDDQHVMFVMPITKDDQLIYHLVRLNIENGEISTIAERFWEIDKNDEQAVNDYILSAHYTVQANGAYGKLMITSYSGRVWVIDVASQKVLSSGENLYPAYGDLGSTPPRELVFPSPDLERFVYQEKNGRNFKIIDTDSWEVVGEFSFDDKTSLMEPGIEWSPDSSSFYIEYGSSDKAIGIPGDNGMLLFAEGIRFYDRNGVWVQTFDLPKDSNKRMNVYGWEGADKIWIEDFQPVLQERGDPLKKNSSYKLYDLATGKQTAYKTTDDFSKMKDASAIRRDTGYNFQTPSYLLVDRSKHLIWQSPVDDETILSNDMNDTDEMDHQLYSQIVTDGHSYIRQWNGEQDKFKRIVSDVGEVFNNEMFYDLPTIHHNEWLLYERRAQRRIDYVRFVNKVERDAEGLPIVPIDFQEQRDNDPKWWETANDNYIQKNDATDLRARGISRYGKLELYSEPGELSRTPGSGFLYYGSYHVTFTDQNGIQKGLPSLSEVALHQQKTIAEMSKYEFDDFDLLLFQPRGYPFSKGYDGGIRSVMAYAVTKAGDAFPLTFVYNQYGEGKQSTLTLPLDDNVSIKRKGEQLIAGAWIGGRMELALTPNLEGRTLTITDLIDRTEEYDELMDIVNRYSKRLEQAIGIVETDYPEGKLDEKKLRGLFSNKAWRNPGFQHLYQQFASDAKKGSATRAFAWQPIDARFLSEDTIRFTFTLNLWYAIGLAAHLEVGIKQVDGEWTFYDLGTLETEKIGLEPNEGMLAYEGLLIKDKLELD